MKPRECGLLANLGSEEGNDWAAVTREPTVRTAARLWSLLFSSSTRLHTAPPASLSGEIESTSPSVGELWPSLLGEPPEQAVYPWLEAPSALVPWLSTSTLLDSLDEADRDRIWAPSPAVVARVHDKAFADRVARRLDLMPSVLSPLVEVLEPEDFDDIEALHTRLASRLESWPAWTGRRYTLKPRFGSSGRGRVGGTERIDAPTLRGAAARLAARGGAIFEPWLGRCADLSTCLYLPGPSATEAEAATPPTLLGTLEMLSTPSGVYRGHCGEIDHRGRVFSGHRREEEIRGDAAVLAAEARSLGYFGPCGVDAMTFSIGGPAALDSAEDARAEILRSAVEFNARPTMGLVAIGLLRRVWPRYRRELSVEPGDRVAFLWTTLDGPGADAQAESIGRAAGNRARPLLWPDVWPSVWPGVQDEPGAPRPVLFFGDRLETLRRAYRDVLGC
jgi:hypothetical protein